MKYTKESLLLTQKISDEIDNKTFHHHYHILFDIANSYEEAKNLSYVEIGCYAGGSACLMLQRLNTNVISIDLGIPIPQKTVEDNVKKLNKLNNNFTYIKGNSQDKFTLSKLKSIVKSIDILFIDGDHSFNGVITDFLNYSDLVVPGGYIIFDDYNDSKYSPQVKPAVDSLLNDISLKYEIIGTINNTLNARPIEMIDGNCFIIKKI